MKQRKMEMRTSILGLGALSMLGLLGMLLVCPTSYEMAQAVSENPPTETVSTVAKIYANATISLALENRVEVEIVPKSNGSFSNAKTNVKVATNNRDGYALYLRAADDGRLKNINDSTITNTIDPVAGENLTEATMTANTWGYSMDGKNYSGVSGSDMQIYQAGTATDQENHELYIGVKIDLGLPAGVYAGEVIVSAIANPMKITSLTALRTMQEMTTDICEASPEGAETQLTDLRDGRTYWVGKLKDGKCWMQQNLDLELDVDSNGNAVAVAKNGDKVTLTNQNTDISVSTWNVNDSTRLAPLKTSTVVPSTSMHSNNVAGSWDVGEIVLTNPTSTQACSGMQVDNYTAILVSGENLGLLSTRCSERVQRIDDSMSATLVATENSSYEEKDGVKKYDAHYLFGNMYSRNAVTAGTSKTTVNDTDNATDSICPKGWRLPTGDEQSKMLAAYGANTVANDGLIKITTGPIYTVSTGGVTTYRGIYSSLGYNGGCISSTGSSSKSFGYYYTFYDTIEVVGNIGSNLSTTGFTARCVAE